MLTTVAAWELQRWSRKSPRLHGVLSLLVFPLLLLLPWKRSGLFSNQFEASLILTALYTFLVAATFGAEGGDETAGEFWLYQKGLDRGDYAFTRLLVSAGAGLTCIAIEVVFVAIGMALHHDYAVRNVLVCSGVSFALLLALLALYFLLGSFNIKRKSEIIVLLVLLSFAQDLLLHAAPRIWQRIVHVVLPPFPDTFSLTSAVANAQWYLAVASLLHLMVFLLICAAGLSFATRRRIPRASP